MSTSAIPGAPTSKASVSVHRAVFGPLSHSDASTAIVKRLRSAIGVGFLADGEKLPREADLARQLGVSVFSLREALSVLRDEGLITTRAGRNGGSFAQTPLDPTPVARSVLTQLSASELADLGDWRQMLIGQSAALAARRASDSSIESLSTFIADMESAETLREARRAYGRFHLELAAASQSVRLTRAELTMNEEFSLLITLLIDSPSSRGERAASLRRVISAVRDRKPNVARREAQQAQAELVHELLKLRLALISTKYPARDQAVPFLSTSVDLFAKELTEHLRGIAAVTAPLLYDGASPRIVSACVARAVLAEVDSYDPVPFGLGVVAEVGVLPGYPYWIDWWHRGAEGQLERDESHVLDSAHDDFYDYEHREFMKGPREFLSAWAMGPIVDYGGVDDYVITVSVPMVHRQRFVGVAAADFKVADLEAYFAPWLATEETPCVLINSEYRVVLSNSSNHDSGSIVAEGEVMERTPLDCFGWALARLEPSPLESAAG